MAEYADAAYLETAQVKRPRRFQTGLRGLIALVACCAVILWTARVVWQNRDPYLAEERALEARARQSLRSPNTTSRVAAIQDLGRLSFADNAIAVRSLTEMLGDQDPQVRAASADALGEFGVRVVETVADRASITEAVTALIKLLKDPQPSVRAASAITLGYIASARPLPVDDAAQPGGMNAAAPPAAVAGTPVDTRAVIAAVIDSLGDSEGKVRGAAIVALAAAAGSMAGPPQALAASLKDPSAENRESAVRTLTRFRRGLDSWIPSLLELAERDPDEAVRTRGLQALKADIFPTAVTAEGIPALIKGLRSRDRKVQWAVANLLGRLGPKAKDAAPVLLCVMTDPIGSDGPGSGYERQNLVFAARDAFSRIVPGSDQVEEFVANLTGTARSGDHILQCSAIRALSYFYADAAPAIPVLIQLVREARPGHDDDIVQAAAQTLGMIASDTPAADEVMTVLLTVLRSESAPARIAAIEALGHFGTKSAIAVPKIRSLCDDPDALVKQAAARTLVIIQDDRDAQTHE